MQVTKGMDEGVRHMSILGRPPQKVFDEISERARRVFDNYYDKPNEESFNKALGEVWLEASTQTVDIIADMNKRVINIKEGNNKHE